MNDAQLLTEMGTDAAKWTDEFLARFPEGTNDWGTLVGWFANAIEVGRGEAARLVANPNIDEAEETLEKLADMPIGIGFRQAARLVVAAALTPGDTK